MTTLWDTTGSAVVKELAAQRRTGGAVLSGVALTLVVVADESRVTEIALVFKRAPHLPFADTDTEELGNNQLVVRVQPDEGVTLKFGSKVPGSVMEVRDVSMDFLYGEQFTEASPEAYERLLLDVLLGDATLFPRNAEVEASWTVIDPLEEFWAGTTPHPYRAGEWGPRAADEMLAAEGRRWRRP